MLHYSKVQCAKFGGNQIFVLLIIQPITTFLKVYAGSTISRLVFLTLYICIKIWKDEGSSTELGHLFQW